MGDRTARLTRAPLCALALAVGLGLGVPFRAGTWAFDGSGLLVWLALVPCVWLGRLREPVAAGVWTGMGAGGGFALGRFWLLLDPTLGVGPFAGAVAATALVFGVAGGWAAALDRRLPPALGAWALPCAWVVAETALVALVGPAAAGGLALGLWRDGPALELAALGGGPLLSLTTAAIAVQLGRGRFRMALLGAAAVHALGFGLRVYHQSQPTPPGVRTAVVQAGPDDAACARTFLEATELLLEVSAAPPELVVWPPGSLGRGCAGEGALDPALDPARLAGLVGVDAATLVAGEAPDPGASARVWRIGPSGSVRVRESSCRAPLRAPWQARPVPVSSAESPARPVGSVLLCYELSDRERVRGRVRAGARLLVELADDSAYGRTGASEQRIALAALRAAEFGVPVLRVARTGGSAVVDAGGWVQVRGPLFEAWSYVGPLPTARPRPPAVWAGDWVVWGSAGFLLLMGGWCGVRDGTDRGSRRRP